ncbi:hypothetical protein [Kitasatospora sp. NPDC059571]|uniref:hypothetical protein n=1 Tax=Kitasatospora sp. NPDC059571 TaxID=3346871 RepID=UPI00368C8F45
MASTDDILALVRRALDEFDDRPLDVSVRRAVRIAGLVGDTRAAARLANELRPIGGAPTANAATLQRLMPDPSSWGVAGGDFESAHEEYLRDRLESADPRDAVDPDKTLFIAHSIDEIEFWIERADRLQDQETPKGLALSLKMREIATRTRHRTFSYLCEWERRFGYTSINESIFGGYKEKVDKLLSEGIPAVIEQFTAVYRRLNEAATSDPDKAAGEELAQAITTCRRILEAVVDHVLPAQDEPSATGHKLDQPAYRNRLFEFIKRANESDSVSDMTVTLASSLHDRYTAVGKLTNKGVHASVALQAANLCALNTYIVCGEILLLKEQEPGHRGA